MKCVDASLLPSGALDYKAPVWWGNVLLLVIETMVFAFLVTAYLYFRQNIEPWPPPRVQGGPPFLLDPNPSLLVPTIGLVLLLASGVTAAFGDRAAWNMDRPGMLRWDGVTLLLAVLVIVLRFAEFDALHFRWDENAYASTVWAILGLHLAHLLVGLLEVGNTTLYVYIRGLDKKHALDAIVSTVYWFWVVGIWVALYCVVYLLPLVL